MANAVLEDIAAKIGFSATVRLAAVHGRSNIYIPARISAAHPLARLLGLEIAQTLSKEFGNEILYVGDISDFERWRMVRSAAAMFKRGMSIEDITSALMISKPTCRKLLKEADAINLVQQHAASQQREGDPQQKLPLCS